MTHEDDEQQPWATMHTGLHLTDVAVDELLIDGMIHVHRDPAELAWSIDLGVEEQHVTIFAKPEVMRALHVAWGAKLEELEKQS